MSQVSRTEVADTSTVTLPRTRVDVEAATIETDDYSVTFREDHDLAGDMLGDPTVLRIEMVNDKVFTTDRVFVDPADGDNLEAVRRAIETLTVVRDQLDIIDRRNRGLEPRS